MSSDEIFDGQQAAAKAGEGDRDGGPRDDHAQQGHSGHRLGGGGVQRRTLPRTTGQMGGWVQRRAAPASGAAVPEGDAADKGAADTPALAAGEPYRWVPGRYALWVRRSWLTSAQDFHAAGDRWFVPSRARELLLHLRDKGMLHWATDEAIQRAAGQLAIDGSHDEIFGVRLLVSIFGLIGLPPGTSALVGFQGDGGLEVVVSVADAEAGSDGRFPLSEAHRAQIVRALEGFTSLPIRPDKRQEFLGTDGITNPLIAGTSRHRLTRAACDDWFGATPYAALLDRPRGQTATDFGVGDSQSFADLGPDEIAYVEAWLKAHLGSGAGAPVPVAMSRDLLEALRAFDRLPPALRDRVLAMLRARGARGEAGLLTPATLDRLIHEAGFEEAREQAGFAPIAHQGAARDPVFDVPLPARLDQQSGLVVSGEEVELTVAIDWPAAYTMEQDSDYTWRPKVAAIDWVFERVLPGGTPRRDRKQSSTDGGRDGTRYRFQLEKGEDQAVWTVHAFVRHNFFQPNHLTTQIEVKTEARRLEELRADAFAPLGAPAIDDADHDFATSRFNETFGDRAYDHGLRFRGELPEDFQRRTPEQRQASLDAEIEQNEQLLRYLRATGEHPEAVAAAEHYVAKLRDAGKALAVDAGRGWQSFEVRGGYLGRGNRLPDGPLDLLGAVRTDGGEVHVQLRDLSRRLDAENYRFEGVGATYEAALEEAFLRLCKKYPAGKVTLLAEAFDPTGANGTGKTVGFELDTGTEWEDVKENVFDPMANLAVNIGSAIVMVVFPQTIPILLPLTIAYNEAQNLDQFVDDWETGTLTTRKAAMHIAQLGLDVMPLLGRAPIFRFSRTAFAMFEIANFGEQALLMTMQVQESIRALRDNQIRDMAELYAAFVDLEKSTQASDPRLRAMRAELDRRGEAIRGAAVAAWTEAVESQAIVMVPGHLAQMIDHHVTMGRLGTLEDHGRYLDVDGIAPYYDRRRGQIVGDRGRMTRPIIGRLTAELDADMLDLARGLAAEIGVTPDRIVLKPGDQMAIWQDGDQIQVRYKPGTDTDYAIFAWKEQAQRAGVGDPARAQASREHGDNVPEPVPLRPIPEAEREARRDDLERIREGERPGRVRRPNELSTADVAMSMNEQLQRVTPEDVDRIIESFPARLRDQARTVLGRASGFASTEALDALRLAMDPHLVAGSWLYLPGSGSLADVMAYHAGKGAFDGLHTESGSGLFLQTRKLRRRALVIVDDVVLQKIRTDRKFARQLVEKECVLIEPRGFNHGLNLFNTQSPEAIALRTQQLLRRSRQLQERSGGTMSFDDAVTAALDEGTTETLRAANPALAGRLHVVDAAEHPDLSNQGLSDQLNDDTGITTEELDRVLAELPEEYRNAARELLAREAQVYSPRRIASELAEHHQRILQLAAEQGVAAKDVYFYVAKEGKSYGTIAMAHRTVTGVPVDHYINGADDLMARRLGPNTMIVLLDDLAGSGSSLGNAISDRQSGVNATAYRGHVLVAPLVATSWAGSRVTHDSGHSRRSNLAYEPHQILESVRNSEYFRSLPREHRERLLTLMGNTRGYGDDGLSLAFPYMAPDNGSNFFGDLLAPYFITNHNRRASKASRWERPQAERGEGTDG